ncbi:hypothetical protein I4F81_006102 [Pyropia yezoensis]|uniref:Uncharacterized protein n=1 Tax=Pyropia yezoensis TaxID=2788 RepID=A0ACC3C169_PYRYE|nr:hypothetical protein I4F81_006102 [Neopyropia yezoensis]
MAAGRRRIVARSDALGVRWADRVAALNAALPALEAHRAAVTDASVTPPAYYLAPFHAYPDGNVGWAPALEVEASALAVHAPLDPTGGLGGDALLRTNFMRILREHVDPGAVRRVVDLGCSTGLSTFALADAFPDTAITGVDLSPHMLAVARYRAAERAAGGGDGDGGGGGSSTAATAAAATTSGPITFIHRRAEDTRLPAASVDLVTLSLVAHELPSTALAAIATEAARLLRSGGTFALMDADPAAWAAVPPPVFVLFASTEPWVGEYARLDVAAVLERAGLAVRGGGKNTARHRTVVAVKEA